jgi:hypothetical protein
MSSVRPKTRVLIVAEQESHRASVHDSLAGNEDLDIASVLSKDFDLQSAIRSGETDLVFWAAVKNGNGSGGRGYSNDFQLIALPVARCEDWQAARIDGGASQAGNELSEELVAYALRQAKRFLGFESPARIIGEIESKVAARDRLCIKSRGRILFLSTSEIRWIEGAGNYLRIHVESESHLVRETIADFEAKLDPERFVRIHRSAIVNLDAIREMRPWPTGEYVVTLKDGKELTLSRSYRGCVSRLISGESRTARPSSSSSFKQAPNKSAHVLRMCGS